MKKFKLIILALILWASATFLMLSVSIVDSLDFGQFMTLLVINIIAILTNILLLKDESEETLKTISGYNLIFKDMKDQLSAIKRECWPQ